MKTFLLITIISSTFLAQATKKSLMCLNPNESIKLLTAPAHNGNYCSTLKTLTILCKKAYFSKKDQGFFTQYIDQIIQEKTDLNCIGFDSLVKIITKASKENLATISLRLTEQTVTKLRVEVNTTKFPNRRNQIETLLETYQQKLNVESTSSKN